MASANDTTDTGSSDLSSLYDIFIPVLVQFWLYLVLDVLSILCSIFALYHLLFDKTLRQALNNHVIIVLLVVGLIYDLTTVPFMLHFFSHGNTWQITDNFSKFWTFMDYTAYAIELTDFAWATIERHILIFHQSWLSTQKKRLFIHYLPITAIVIYCFLFYVVILFYPFCNGSFVQPTNGVPVPCMLFTSIIGRYDAICHQIIPTFTIAVFSLALLVRVLWLKSRMNRGIQWRQQKKMVIQLLSISTLYLLFNFPRAIIQIYVTSGVQSYYIIKAFAHLIFFAVHWFFIFHSYAVHQYQELK